MSDYFAPMAPDAMGNLRVAGGDARLFVVFSRKSRRNAHKSEIEGRPVHEPVDYVRIQQPGERDAFEGPVTEEHKRRFPDRWRQYLENTEQTPEGTPVQLLFPNEPHVVELCLDLRIQTVEQLAGLTEQAIDRLGMDGRKYVAKAQAALDRSEAVREVSRLEGVVASQADEIDVLKRANDDLAARMAAMERLMQRHEPQPWQGANAMVQPLPAADSGPRRLHITPAEEPPPPRPGLVS